MTTSGRDLYSPTFTRLKHTQLRDQVQEIEQCTFGRVDDRACTWGDCEWKQSDVSRDGFTDRTKQVAGLELVHEQARVIGREGNCQRVEGIGDWH